MNIRFQQSGGFTGIRRGCVMTDKELPPDLVKLARDLAREHVPAPDLQSRDAFQVKLEIESDGQSHDLDVVPEELPEKYAKLFDHLREHSKPLPL